MRSALPEGLDAANNRLSPGSEITAFCGATIWRDKYSLGVAGGHAGTYDDGHYAQDLASGNWEMLLPPSEQASTRAVADAFGEWTPNRPASQHSYFHHVTVGDDIILGCSYAVGFRATGSGQAHRWNGRAGAWERYGAIAPLAPLPHAVLYDSRRNRIARFALANSPVVRVIAANDRTASWTDIPVSNWAPVEIYGSMGLHVALDCFVMIDQHQSPNRVWVMDPDRISAGWVEVPVQGSAATPMISGGLEYVPPMRAFASANMEEADALYYLAPTGGRLDPWAWYKERFTGSVPAAAWETTQGTLASPQGRVKWSSLLNGLVMVKGPGSLTEVFRPSLVAAGG